MIELTLIGNLGQDPEIKYTKNDEPFAVCSVAVNRGYYDKKGKWIEQDPIWVSVLCFGYMCDKAEKLTKGTPVFVKGVPSINVWVDDRDEARANQVCVAKVLRGFSRDNEEDSGRKKVRRSRRREEYNPEDYQTPL